MMREGGCVPSEEPSRGPCVKGPTVPAINSGSPIGPGFVVYERAKGQPGYDLEMAKQSVGQGWGPLLQSLFDTIKSMATQGDVVSVIQVKEKFGLLRVYTSPHNEYVEGYVHGLEAASAQICERCGNAGHRRGGSWVQTLCDHCHLQDKEKGS